MVCAVEAMGLPMSLLILVCACFVLDGGAEFGDAERCEGVWHGGEEGVGVLAGAALKVLQFLHRPPIFSTMHDDVFPLDCFVAQR